jgi:hypothetical protein
VTVPPIAAPSTPPFGVVDLDALAADRRSGRGRSWAMIAGAAVVVLVGGAVAGRSMLAGRSADSSGAAAQAPATPPPAPEPATPLPSQEDTMRALQALTPGAAPAASSAAPDPSPAPAATPSAKRRARPTTTKATKPAEAQATPAKAAAPSGPQSLDDLMRKAVSDHSK